MYLRDKHRERLNYDLITVVSFPVYTDLVFVSTLPMVQPYFGWQEIGGDITIPSGKYIISLYVAWV